MKKISKCNLVAIYNKNSCCEISCFDDNVWFINRVFVNKSFRKNNLGSNLLNLCIDDIITKYNPKSIIVTPGGYNIDEKIQFNFYLKNGFEFSQYDKNVLYYKKLKDI